MTTSKNKIVIQKSNKYNFLIYGILLLIPFFWLIEGSVSEIYGIAIVIITLISILYLVLKRRAGTFPKLEFNNKEIVYYRSKEIKRYSWDSNYCKLNISHRIPGHYSLKIVSKSNNDLIDSIDMDQFKTMKPHKLQSRVFNATQREIEIDNTWW